MHGKGIKSFRAGPHGLELVELRDLQRSVRRDRLPETMGHAVTDMYKTANPGTEFTQQSGMKYSPSASPPITSQPFPLT